MSVALITNGFFVTDKTEEIKELLVKAFLDKGIKPILIRNNEIFAANFEQNLADIDAALFWDKDVLLASYLESKNVKVINNSDALRICDDKALSAITLFRAGIPMPKTVVAPFTYQNIGYDSVEFLSGITSQIDFPIVIKESHGSFGQQVYLARNYDELAQTVKKIAPRPMIFQQYVECGNSDLRLQVVGNEVVAAVKRESLNGDFRANATLGGKMTAYTPTAEQIELALAAARAVGAEIAGVDILPGDKPYLCEVNANAHFKRLMDATKIDVAAKIIEYVLGRV